MTAMCRWVRFGIVILLVLAAAGNALAHHGSGISYLSLAGERGRTGEGFWLAYHPPAPEGAFYTYWPQGFEAPQIEWRLPEGFRLGRTEWPAFHKYEAGGRTVFGFEAGSLIFQEILIPEGGLPDGADISLFTSYFVCTDECRPLFEEGRVAVSRQDLAALSEASETTSEAAGLITGRELAIHANAGTNGEFTFAVNFRREDKSSFVKGVYFLPLTEGVVAEGHLLKLKKSTAEFYQDAFKGYLGAVPMADGADQLERVSGLVVFDLGAERPVEAFPVTRGNDYREIAALEVSGGGETARGGLTLLTAALFALLGGVILNLMPCVLPVLSLKVFSFLKSGGASVSRRRTDGLSYTAGVVLSFAAVGGILMALRAAGGEVAWGFQLQSPAFVLVISLLLFAMALSFLGAFDISLGRFAGIGQNLANREGPAGAFSTGVLATIVATPCTAPFMAAALAFALARPPGVGLVIFVALGFGLALPYLLLSFAPALGRLLPKPGPWMQTFRQFLAFPLIATVIWLLWTLSIQTGPRGVLVALSALFALSLAVWLWRTLKKPLLREVLTVLLVVAALIPVVFSREMLRTADQSLQFGESKIEVTAYSEEELARLQAEGRPVFLHFWASWCPICIMHEQFVFKTEAFQRFAAQHDMAFLYIDNTIYTPENVRLMESFGRSGQPIDVFFAPGKEPLVLPELYNASYLLATLEQALD